MFAWTDKKLKAVFSVQYLICLFEVCVVVSSQPPVALKPVCTCQVKPIDLTTDGPLMDYNYY